MRKRGSLHFASKLSGHKYFAALGDCAASAGCIRNHTKETRVVSANLRR